MHQQIPIPPPNAIPVKLFDFIDLHPTPVKNIFVSPSLNKIFIARQNYSEIYAYESAESPHQVIINQITRLQQCQYLLEYDGVLIMIKPFELRTNRNGSWAANSFTTQMISMRFDEKNGKLYTFHEKQSVQWEITMEDGVSMRYLQKLETPYHINSDGILEGYGKKIQVPTKASNFTVLEYSECGQYIFVGTDKGTLYIYQTKFMTNIKAITRHEAPILAIKAHRETCYFTGSDSKVSSIRLNDQTGWTLSAQARGQSHDITALGVSPDNKFLISAGLTTDLCFYEFDAENSGNSTKQKVIDESLGIKWAHKISYSSEELVCSLDNYIVVNRLNSFQIWKNQTIGESDNTHFLVKYDLPFHKTIKQLKAKYWDKHREAILLVVVTEFEAVTWIFTESEGLLKHSTITNSYNLIQFIENSESLLTLREGHKLQKLDYKTGRISQLAEVEIDFPNSLKMIRQGNQMKSYIFISSKYSRRIDIYELKEKKNFRICELSKTIHLDKQYDILDFYGPGHLLIKYFASNAVYSVNISNNEHSVLVELPVRNIRYGGWIQKTISAETKRTKTFWYGVSEGKIVLVSNLKNKKPKKIRIKQFPRIGTVITNNSESESWSLGVIPLNFKQHMKTNVLQPVIVKKIQ